MQVNSLSLPLPLPPSPPSPLSSLASPPFALPPPFSTLHSPSCFILRSLSLVLQFGYHCFCNLRCQHILVLLVSLLLLALSTFLQTALLTSTHFLYSCFLS